MEAPPCCSTRLIYWIAIGSFRTVATFTLHPLTVINRRGMVHLGGHGKLIQTAQFEELIRQALRARKLPRDAIADLGGSQPGSESSRLPSPPTQVDGFCSGPLTHGILNDESERSCLSSSSFMMSLAAW